MSTVLLTLAAAGVLLAALYALWGGVHLLANYRMGFRRMGCQGPRTDAYGKQVCCKSGEECDEIEYENTGSAGGPGKSTGEV